MEQKEIIKFSNILSDVRDYVSLLVGQLWKNCTVTQNSWLKRKVGLFVLLVLSFDLCSLSPAVVCLRSLTIYNVHISFVLLISNSVYTIQLSRTSGQTLNSQSEPGKSSLWTNQNVVKGTSWVHQGLLWKTENNPNSNSTFSCCC